MLTIQAGTTLIVSYCPSGMVMAVDDLGHSKDRQGNPMSGASGIEKLFALSGGILLGSTGLISHPGIEYKFKDWVSEFIEAKYGALADKRPRSVTTALENQMRETFHRIQELPDDEVWKKEPPVKRLVTYIVAGFAEDLTCPDIFEFGAELSPNRRQVEYAPALQYRSQNPIIFGEEHFLRRALRGLDPERSYWLSTVESMDVRAALPKIPAPLQQLTSGIVGLIKVEAKFNGHKVGTNVRVAVIDPMERTPIVATF